MITLETQSLIGSLLPLLPSVQILFDSFCGTGVVISAAIGPRRSKGRSAVCHARKRTYRMITLETQPLIGSLLPLLPSVQILFDSFCGTGVLISAAIRPGRSKGRSRGISRSKKDLLNDHVRTQSLIGLCFLCYLLFKSSSFPSVAPELSFQR